MARRQSPQTFEKRRRERDKKRKKEEKQQARIWRNAEKRAARLKEEDPEKYKEMYGDQGFTEDSWYYYD